MKKYQNIQLQWLEEARIDLPLNGIIQWLEKQNSDTWHVVATGWNWDHGSDPLHWIVSQPSCDMGTACYIFFIEASHWVKSLDPSELGHSSYRTGWKTCKKISDRWHKNDFNNRSLFPSREMSGNDYVRSIGLYREREHKSLSSGEGLAWTVPNYVYDYRGTRVAESDYDFGDGELFENFSKWKTRLGLKDYY
ncbi:MAG: DUF4274 domain-containing protein [Stappiaceae bacterium]